MIPEGDPMDLPLDINNKSRFCLAGQTNIVNLTIAIYEKSMMNNKAE